jgi:hypothetical protein
MAVLMAHYWMAGSMADLKVRYSTADPMARSKAVLKAHYWMADSMAVLTACYSTVD